MASETITQGALADHYYRQLTAGSKFSAVRRPDVRTPEPAALPLPAVARPTAARVKPLPPPEPEPEPAPEPELEPPPDAPDEPPPTPRPARTVSPSTPVGKRPVPSGRLSAGSMRGRILVALAGHGWVGLHGQALAVGLWSSDGETSRVMWGYSQFPEHCNCGIVIAKLSELRAAGLVHLGAGSVYRVTQAGMRVAARLRSGGAASMAGAVEAEGAEPEEQRA